VPAKNLPEWIRPLAYYGTIRGSFPRFREMPMCVFGFDHPYLLRRAPSWHDAQGAHCVPSSVGVVPGSPLKKKIPMCGGCNASEKCDGFFATDIDRYGPGDLRPIA